MDKDWMENQQVFVRQYLERRWVACYMLYNDYNFDHAQYALMSNWSRFEDKASKIRMQCIELGKDMSEDEALNRALAFAVHEWIEEYTKRYGMSEGHLEHNIAEMVVEIYT